MKKGILIVVLSALIGILAFFLARGKPSSDRQSLLIDAMPELTWLKSDLGLTDEQFAKVQKLHRDYRPVCAKMCRRIAESEKTVSTLAGKRRDLSEDLAQAIENHAHVIAECKRSMLDHMYETASLMDERQAQRYLDVTLPHALDTAYGRTTTPCHE